MSVYQLQKVMYHLNTDADAVERYRKQLENFVAQYDLTEEEKAALLDLDFGKLFKWGVDGLLLISFSRVNGVSQTDYYAALNESN